MKDALLLVFANKQDISGGEYILLGHKVVSSGSKGPVRGKDDRGWGIEGRGVELVQDQQLMIITAMRPNEVSQRLKLDEVAKNHVWKVEPSCATTGEGIFEGLVSSFLATPINRNRGPQTDHFMQAWLSSHVKEPPR